MKYAFLFVIIGLYGCKESELKKRLKQSDELTIHFFSNSQSDSVIKIVHTTSRKAVEQLANFIDGKEEVVQFCGHDGDIVFKKNNKVIDTVFFNALQKNCRQFYFYNNGKQEATKINNEAADFLTALWAGKSSY